MIAIIEEKRDQVAVICRHYGVRRLDVFGSAATGQMYDPQRSDLDFIVEFEPTQSLGPWLKHYFEFQAELQRLFQHPVDVVMASALKHRGSSARSIARADHCMRPKTPKLLDDIRDAAGFIQHVTQGKSVNLAIRGG